MILRLNATFFGVLLMLTAAVSVYGDKTSVFQAGVSPAMDYTGCGDTFVASDYAERNLGEFRHLVMAGGKFPSRILISFSLGTHIKPTSKIIKATLYLYPKVCISPDNTAVWYVVNSPWNENSATWNKSETGEEWKAKGGDMREGFKSGKPRFDAAHHSWDVKEIISEIVTYPHKNYGMILISSRAPATSTTEMIWLSRESRDSVVVMISRLVGA